jgi:hypothetical protein
MLSTAAGMGIRLTGVSRVTAGQLQGLEIVVFGRRQRDPVRPWPMQAVDSFVVRSFGGEPTRDGVLRKRAEGDVLELRDGRRLSLRHLPEILAGADGKRVWIAGPLDAPIQAGVIDPAARFPSCPE